MSTDQRIATFCREQREAPKRRLLAMIPLVAILPCCGEDPRTSATIDAAEQPLQAGVLPSVVSVAPVFLVPSDRAAPTSVEHDKLRDHLAWAQTRYREMLKDRDTFRVSGTPTIVTDTNPASYWANADSSLYMKKMLSAFGFNRFSNPYIYLVVAQGVSGSTGGVTINGGINTGGGLIVVRQESWSEPNFQSTLQHELGHGFGLSHSWSSGYGSVDPSCEVEPTDCSPSPLACRFSQLQGWTIMSYNPCHHTTEMTPAEHPGVLLPEDINNLSLNKRVFPNLYFNPETDLPSGVTGVYRLLAHQGSAAIGGQVSAELAVTTSSGEAFGSAVATIARNVIRKSNPTVGFDPNTMWHSSGTDSNGWASVTVQFPMTVTLTGIGVHTQHSGAYHSADQVRVAFGNSPQLLTQQAVSTDDVVSFNATSASKWRFSFHSTSGYVVVRGLQFFAGGGTDWSSEIFSNRYPTELVNYLDAAEMTSAAGAINGSKVANAVTGWAVPPNDAQTGFQPQLMWHSGATDAQGSVTLIATFPYPITLSGVEVFSQFGGTQHQATQVGVQYRSTSAGVWVDAKPPAPTLADASLDFEPVVAAQVALKLFSTSGFVVVRKVRFKSPLTNGYHERPDAVRGPEIAPLN